MEPHTPGISAAPGGKTPLPSILPVLKETKVGSYFVSNYPPYSFWSPAHLDQAFATLDKPPAPGTPLGVYLHIPFCRKRCHFCYFKVYTDKNSDRSRALPRHGDRRVETLRRQARHRRQKTEIHLLRWRHSVVYLFAPVDASGGVDEAASRLGMRPKKSRSSVNPARSPKASSRSSRISESPASASASKISTTQSCRPMAGPTRPARSIAPIISPAPLASPRSTST